MFRQGFIIVLLLLITFGSAAAQEEDAALTAADVAAFAPLGFAPDAEYAVSNGRYAVTMRNRAPDGSAYDAALIDLESGDQLFDFGRTSAVRFVGEGALLWIGAYDTQSPRVYALPEMQEVGRFPLGIFPVPRRYGEGYLYRTEGGAYYQPADLQADPVVIAANQGYSLAYSGALLDMPDGHTLLAAGVNGIMFYDLDSGEVVKRIDYPLAQMITLSEDGARFSAVTNYDPLSAPASNWLVYDLARDEPLVEVYGNGGSHGMISADGRYAAGTRWTGGAGIGELGIYDLETGEIVHSVSPAAHGSLGFNAYYYGFYGDHFVYLNNWNGDYGTVSVYEMETDTVYDTDVPAYYLQPLDGTLIQISMSSFDQLNRWGVFDVATHALVREFPAQVGLNPDGETLLVGGLVYGQPSRSQPAMLTLTGHASGVNVRMSPDPNALRRTNAVGEVSAVARNSANTWIYLASHGGWVSRDVVTWEGDTGSLPVMP